MEDAYQYHEVNSEQPEQSQNNDEPPKKKSKIKKILTIAYIVLSVLAIAYATDYENRYGYEHKIVQTRKNKEEADKNRRLAAIYNRICEGHEYPIEVVREVQKYIRNKNQYLQKLIDEKKAQSYMAFSEKEWVARLESQLRDESVFLQAKLESDCEFESNIWGEPNPLDIFIEEAV